MLSDPFRRSGQFLFSRPHQCLSPRWMPISSRKPFGRPRLWARTLLSIVGFHLELFEWGPDEVLSGRVGTMSRGKSSGACVARAYVKFLPRWQRSAGKPHNSWIRHTYQLNSCVREFHRSHSINSCRRSVLQWPSSPCVRLPTSSKNKKSRVPGL